MGFLQPEAAEPPQAQTDIRNLLAEFDVVCKDTEYDLDPEDAAIVNDIRERWAKGTEVTA